MAVIPRRQQPPPRAAAPSTRAGNEFDVPDYSRPPGDAPELPDDLTDLDDVDLMNLLTALTRWHDFLSVRLSKAEVEARRADQKLSEAQADALVLAWGEVRSNRGDSVTVAKAKRDTTPQVQEAAQRALDTYAYRKRLEVRTEAFSDDAFVVSRELTRRTNMEPPRRRESRWGGS